MLISKTGLSYWVSSSRPIVAGPVVTLWEGAKCQNSRLEGSCGVVDGWESQRRGGRSLTPHGRGTPPTPTENLDNPVRFSYACPP